MKSEARKQTNRYRKKMTEKQEQYVAWKAGEYLVAHYPGHLWATRVDQNVLTVKNLGLDCKMGFTIKLSSLDPEGKKLVMAGGELLERYRQRRGRASEDAIMSEKRDIAGNVIADI